MPFGKEAQEELLKIVQWKSLKVLVYGEDRYGRCVGDLYCNGVFVQVIIKYTSILYKKKFVHNVIWFLVLL